MPRVNILWWIAGADSDILSECPKGDRIFVSHLGIALIFAFIFVWSITAISIGVAFPDLGSRGKILALMFGLLIASTVFLVDRSFIISDWEWQASLRRRELAQASWESDSAYAGESAVAGLGWFFPRVRRIIAISFRLMLSLAIGFCIASFLELVIYRDEILPAIRAAHYQENKAIYDRVDLREAEIAHELEQSRESRDRIASDRADVEKQINETTSASRPTASVQLAAQLDTRIKELVDAIRLEQAQIKTHDENLIAERFGTVINNGNSGLRGEGRNFQTNLALKRLSVQRLAKFQETLKEAEAEKQAALQRAQEERAKNSTENEAFLSDLRRRSKELDLELTSAQTKYDQLIADRGPSIAKFTDELKSSADFVPISFGIAAQFRALRNLYLDYGNQIERWMIKSLIVLLELTPMIMKVMLSPKTLYASLLDARRREATYEQLDTEITRRQDFLKKKFDAAMNEKWDDRNLDLFDKDNITAFKGGNG